MTSIARLLFPRESLKDDEYDTYVMQVLTFGSTCSPASAQHVKNLNSDRYEHDQPLVSNAIKTKHYVDDYLQSFESETEAIIIVKGIISVHKQGGFTISN